MGAILAQEVARGGEGGWQAIEALALGLVFFGIIAWIARSMANDSDRSWLPRLIVWGYVAKFLGSLVRFWMVTVLYESGDSFDYHAAGRVFAKTWRALEVPVSTAGGEGTAFTEVVTGFIYGIYTPTLLGGFVIFATLAFLGQLLFLAAFRRWFGGQKEKLYALAILFLPSLIFWPSSIGKDALMVLFLGLATYGASRLLSTYKITSVVLIAGGLLLASRIRPHVAGMLAIALVLAILLGKPLPKLRGSPMRPVLLVGSVLGAVVVLTTFSTTFQVGLEADRTNTDYTGFLKEVTEQTSTGGSEIEGVAVSSPSQLPLAVLTVLFRPVLPEGANAQMIISALEGTALLVVVLRKLPQIWRNRGMLRRNAYLTMCFFYTGGFIVGFSAISNLGIMARQRVQVLPMFLALLVAMGWPEGAEEPAASPSSETRTTRPGLHSARKPVSTMPNRQKTLVGATVTMNPRVTPATYRLREEPEAIEVESVVDAHDDTSPTTEARQKRRRKPSLRDQIRPEVVRLKTEDPSMSVRAVAEAVGASASTVRRVLKEEDLI